MRRILRAILIGAVLALGRDASAQVAPGVVGGTTGGVITSSSIRNNYSGPTNLTGTDTVTFSGASAKIISTLTATETALSFADNRGTACTTTSRCGDTWMLCQDATGNHQVTVSGSNVVWLNGASTLDYPLVASGSSANCQLYYFDFNGTKLIETAESAPFAGP